MNVATRAILAMTLLAALTASACGRKGDPVPPTPAAAEAQDEVEETVGY
ncbi:LPS translocon maturation chaperone LptM [Rhodovulum sp. DZ06]